MDYQLERMRMVQINGVILILLLQTLLIIQAIVFSNITNEAIINIQSGWYEMSQTIIIEPQDGTIVFYTMDGSIPSSDDIAYTQPIEINENTVLSF